MLYHTIPYLLSPKAAMHCLVWHFKCFLVQYCIMYENAPCHPLGGKVIWPENRIAVEGMKAHPPSATLTA